MVWLCFTSWHCLLSVSSLCSSVSDLVAYLGSTAWATLGVFFWPCKEYLALSLWTDLEFSPAIDHYSVHVIIFHCTIISHIWLLFVFALLITYIRHMLVSSESIIQTIQLFFLSKSVAKVIKLNCKKTDSLTVSLKDWKDLVTCAYLILWDSCTPYKLGSLWGTNAES